MEEGRYFDLDMRLEKLGQRRHAENPRATQAFQATLDIGWIYHDNALEGVVLSYHEIKDALDQTSLSVSSRGATSAGIRDHKAAIELIRKVGSAQTSHGQKRGLFTVALLKQLHEILTPADKSQGSPYRKDRLPHRVYHHEIAQADKIPLRLHKLCELLEDKSGAVHPLTRAASAHFEFMAIYPWVHNSGKVARLLMNLLLLCDGYPPAVILDVERQRYYASLRAEDDCLADLVMDTLNTYCNTATQFLDEFARPRRPHEQPLSMR
jgi:Fic family protein